MYSLEMLFSHYGKHLGNFHLTLSVRLTYLEGWVTLKKIMNSEKELKASKALYLGVCEWWSQQDSNL